MNKFLTLHVNRGWQHLLFSLAGAVLVLLALAILTSDGLVSAETINDPQLGQTRRPAYTVGDSLPRIQCNPPYTASIYAEGLSGPDGLAFGPDGLLYVSEESGGEVSQVDSSGVVTTVLMGLNHPEALTFNADGTLYVAEDVKGGRVISMNTKGITGTVATGLDSPEGIVWMDDDSVMGRLYITESNIEYALDVASINPTDYRTHVTYISPAGEAKRLITATAQFAFNPPVINITGWSYSDLALGPDNLLYVANELSGQSLSQPINGGPFTTIIVMSEDSVFKTPSTMVPTNIITPFSNNLIDPEGLDFSANGFPLLVAEEDIDGAVSTVDGRVSIVNAAGVSSTLCTGFEKIEVAITDQAGNLYVTEDETGFIILLTQTNAAPTAVDDIDVVVEDSVDIVLDVLANDTDVDGNDTIHIRQVGMPNQGGTVALSGTTYLIYTPIGDFFGTEVFTYTIQDDFGLEDTATVMITITATNDPPTAQDDVYRVDNTSANLILSVLDNDEIAPDTNETLAITAVGVPNLGGAVNISGDNQALIYTPPAISGTEMVTYAISDSNGGSDIATVIIQVDDTNDAPVARGDEFTVNEDSVDNRLSVLVNDTDIDVGDTLMITSVDLSSNSSAQASVTGTSEILYSPAPDFFGTEVFSYTIEDERGLSDSAVVTVTVENINDAPTFASAMTSPVTITVGSNYSLTIEGSDVDNDTLTIMTMGLSNWLTFSDHGNGTATLSGTPGLDDVGIITLTFEINDSQSSAERSLEIRIVDDQTFIFLPLILRN